MKRDTPFFPPFHFDRWAAVDDRVRGGSSQSHLEPVQIDEAGRLHANLAAGFGADAEKRALGQGHGKERIGARFWGTLDTKTLGGAGFASQRFIFGPRPLHLPRLQYNGIYITVVPDTTQSATTGEPNSPNDFTIVLKTNLRSKPPSPPKVPPSPDPASLSYEATFTAPTPGSHAAGSSQPKTFTFDWDEFKAVYRGREIGRDDPRYEVLDPGAIYEFSLMCRSGFGKQEGDFGVVVLEVGGVKKDSKPREGCLQAVSGWIRGLWTKEGSVALPVDRESKL